LHGSRLTATTKKTRAPVIEERVDRDPPQPGVERGIETKRPERLIRFQPNFLREILGVLSVAAIV